ncbi:DUF805 domain-containing protein [Streptococcus oricebi]|uniref:DUF805 domain-containing protein n=1 Tax=Streptococcus oricebi TaxID=1547447 RepID=A0ABS5B3D8_9STRE|nr:DUF805 domain-containing protein [Streptococcus oricebi]MBP2623339.1 hypothetical protein [Streptococcus oricebi]
MFSAYKKYWKNYVKFEGRASRSDYWWVFLMNSLISFILFLIFLFIIFGGGAAGISGSETGWSGAWATIILTIFPFLIFVVIWGLANFLPNLTLSIRRLRDAGFHWSFIFLPYVPTIAYYLTGGNDYISFINLCCQIAFIVLMCQPSKAVASNYQAGYQGQFNQFNQGANSGQSQFNQNPGQFNQFTPGANPEQGQFGQGQTSFNQFNQANNPAQGQFVQSKEQGTPFPQAVVEEEPTVSTPESVTPSQEEASPFSATEPIQDSAVDSGNPDAKE